MRIALSSQGVLDGLEVHRLLHNVQVLGNAEGFGIYWGFERPGVHAFFEPFEDEVTLEKGFPAGNRLRAVDFGGRHLLHLVDVWHGIVGILQLLLLCMKTAVLLAGLSGYERMDYSSSERVHLYGWKE